MKKIAGLAILVGLSVVLTSCVGMMKSMIGYRPYYFDVKADSSPQQSVRPDGQIFIDAIDGKTMDYRDRVPIYVSAGDHIFSVHAEWGVVLNKRYLSYRSTPVKMAPVTIEAGKSYAITDFNKYYDLYNLKPKIDGNFDLGAQLQPQLVASRSTLNGSVSVNSNDEIGKLTRPIQGASFDPAGNLWFATKNSIIGFEAETWKKQTTIALTDTKLRAIQAFDKKIGVVGEKTVTFYDKNDGSATVAQTETAAIAMAFGGPGSIAYVVNKKTVKFLDAEGAEILSTDATGPVAYVDIGATKAVIVAGASLTLVDLSKKAVVSSRVVANKKSAVKKAIYRESDGALFLGFDGGALEVYSDFDAKDPAKLDDYLGTILSPTATQVTGVFDFALTRDNGVVVLEPWGYGDDVHASVLPKKVPDATSLPIVRAGPGAVFLTLSTRGFYGKSGKMVVDSDHNVLFFDTELVIGQQMYVTPVGSLAE